MLMIGLINLAGLALLVAVALNAMRDQMIESRVKMVRNLAEVGRSVIQRQYDLFRQGEISEDEAKRRAIGELRAMRYANDEYFFIDDYRGYSVLLPIRPELEGTYVLSLVDAQGRYYVQAQRDAAMAGGGVVRYEFTKPGTMQPGEKLSYVLPFQDWGWFIATGIYLDDVDKEIRVVFWRAAGFLAAIALATGLLIHRLSRGITVPLRHLTGVIKRLTAHDYDIQVAGQDRADEVGDIARAIETFKQTGRLYEILQAELREREEQARLAREAALADERDSAVRLEQTGRLVSMGEMAMSLAHELNQPLAAVTNYCMGCVRRLEDGTAETPALLEAMKKASAQATRASKIIAQLRKFLRRNEPSLEAQDIGDIIDETAAIASLEAGRHGISIKTQIAAEVPPIMADKVMIEQVILNLLRNAVEATVAAGKGARSILVSASVDEKERMVNTSVTDFGTGISPADLVRLFEPFFTTKQQGMGVGLNICRSILEFHGGRIWVEANPAGGTTFSFSLPVAGTQ